MNDKIKSKIQKIINFYKIKDYKKAIELSQIFLKSYPESDFVFNLLGLSFQKINQFDKAETSFVIAIQINSDNISAINNLGNNYKYKYNFSKAKEYFKKALEKNTNYTEALLNFGTMEFMLNKNDQALELFKKALKTNDKTIPIHLNLAITYQSLGNFDEAINHLKKINEIDEKFTRADKLLSGLVDYKNENEHFEIMLKKLDTLELTNEQKVYLHFALGKAFEDKKDYVNAFKNFKIGNKIKNYRSDYQIESDEHLLKKIKSAFQNYNFKINDINNNEKKPIFILGMPRSGTTLVEQIISSHTEVEGLGEINFFNKIAEQNFKKIISNNLDLNNLNKNDIFVPYKNFVESFDVKKNYFTDKTLLNFFWIGFIKICYPNAKVINCFRNSKDNCLSIYKNLFDYEGGWCYNENDLTKFYKLYLDISKFWKEKIPNFVYEVYYEKLIDSPEDEIKNLIQYCGLRWNEDCLNFYKNKTAIKTLSVNQARKRMYSTSINSFEKYKLISEDLFKDL